MPIEPESLLTDAAFLGRVEQAIRYTAMAVAVEPRTVESWDARQQLAAALADDAAATDEYAKRFTRLLIGEQGIENACATATTQADVNRNAIRTAVATLWTLFAVRLAKASR